MNQSKDRTVLKWIQKVSAPAFIWAGLLLLVRALQGISCIVYADALRRILDCAQAGNTDAFFRQLALFIALVILTLILQTSGRYLSEKSKTTLEKIFRKNTFSQLIRRDFAQVTDTHTGEWINRITSDSRVVADAVATIVPELTGAVIRMLGAVIALIKLAPTITLILFPSALLITGFSYLIRKRLKYLHKQMQQTDGQSRSFMQERLYSLLIVRAFAQEESTERLASESIDKYIDARMRRFHFMNVSFSLFAVAVNSAQVLGIGICGWGILAGTITYGTMSSVLYLINLLEAPIHSVSGYIAQYSSMLASAERLMEIESFHLDTLSTPNSSAYVRDFYDNRLEAFGLEKVCFSYEDGEDSIVLNDLSLEIQKGEYVAFTGESGCGKSTTMKLLIDLYKTQNGSIYLKQTDGSTRTLDASWRQLFAYVPQGNLLISGTIRELLTFANPEGMTKEAELRKALRIACAENFVNDLPNGLDTVLGERGGGLSEGQMQRLAIARAIFSARPILLLDEATSALDAETEEQLLKNLRKMTDRTVLIITHREAALDICDRQIHFLKNSED